ncbi:MAG: hypothetical protein P9M14_10375 [Candidatus Alcyoniella australis]|nr:hypothetical protein [Candidatus Alcyoniella australis]
MARRRGAHLILAAAAALLLLQLLLSIPFEYNRVDGFDTRFSAVTLDDSWIHFIYARSLSRLQPFWYNPGQPETGTTSPLWCALIAPFLWFGIAPTFASKVLGIIAAAALALLAARIAGRLMSLPFAVAAATLLLLDPLFGFAKLSGMEVLIASALMVGTIAMLLERRWAAASLLGALAVWARPDTLIVALIAVPLLALAALEGKRSQRAIPWRAVLIFAVGPALAALAWGGFCYWATGRWLPATYYIRGQGMAAQLLSLDSARIVLAEMTDGSPLFSGPLKLAWAGIGALALCIWALAPRRRDWVRLLLVLVPLCYLALLGGRVINLIGGSFTGNRYVIPVFALMVIWALYPAHLISEALAQRLKLKRSAIAAWIAALVVVCGLFAPPGHTIQRWRELTREFTLSAQNLELMHLRIGRWINEHYPNEPTLALYDAGAIAYLVDSTAIDIGGLNNSRYEVFDEAHAAADLQWFESYCHRLEGLADLLIIYPQHYPSLARRYSEREVFRVQLDDPLITLGDTMVVYRLNN